MKLRILFVDDEPNVLQGIRRTLYSMKSEWQMSFANNGFEALDLMGQGPFDVVVSDMRMPGMDGAQLLSHVRDQYPDMARIVLSGHSEKEMIVRSVGPTHQYLAKPCPPETLKVAVNRAVAMRRLTIDSALQKMVSRISALPSLPSVYTEMVDALRNEDVGIDQIGKIVAKDIGMMTKVLQLVNSAFFGLPRKVGHPTEAVNYLGLDTIRALVLSIGVFSQFSGRDIGAFSLQRLWDHSMTVGLYAKMIALNETQNTRLADSAFLAGIFHDVGKLVLASELPGEYGEILENVHASGIPDWKMERSRLGTDHAALGAYLLGLWGMDDLITEAVGFHHTPETGAAGESFTPLTAVSAADAISIASVICFSDHLDHSKSPEEHSGSEWHEMDRDIETLIGSNCGKWTEICRRLSEENKASA